MNKLSDEELENVNGGFGTDAGDLVDEIANQIIVIGNQIRNGQPTAMQKIQLEELKLQMDKALFSSKVSPNKVKKAYQILLKYGI